MGWITYIVFLMTSTVRIILCLSVHMCLNSVHFKVCGEHTVHAYCSVLGTVMWGVEHCQHKVNTDKDGGGNDNNYWLRTPLLYVALNNLCYDWQEAIMTDSTCKSVPVTRLWLWQWQWVLRTAATIIMHNCDINCAWLWVWLWLCMTWLWLLYLLWWWLNVPAIVTVIATVTMTVTVTTHDFDCYCMTLTVTASVRKILMTRKRVWLVWLWLQLTVSMHDCEWLTGFTWLTVDDTLWLSLWLTEWLTD